MADRLPLPALASAALVAFTIEADNEVERALEHRTTSFGATGRRGAVWLTSLAMWFNCLRALADDGSCTVAELEDRVRMGTNLDGMRRWGYITIDGTGRVRRGTPRPHAKRGSVLALTPRGRSANAAWRPVPAAVEQRWRERFGHDAVDRLRAALIAIARQIDVPLPDFVPIGRAEADPGDDAPPRDPRQRDADEDLPLVSLLARVLVRYERDHGRATRLRYVAWADYIRVLDADDPVAVRDLPRLTGIAKESLEVLGGRLERAGLVAFEPAPTRGRQVRLTPDRGAGAQSSGRERIARTLTDWKARYGDEAVAAVVAALAPIVADATRERSPLFDGLRPPAETWRSQIRPPRTLPWYPMVTHRGGFPDGS